MNRILVTGATSMIGVALIREAISNNTEIYALVRPNTKRIHRLPDSDLVHVIECDISNLLESCGYFPKVDVFYHLAWEGTSKNERDNPIIQEKNIATSISAVDLAHRIGCKRFIFAGSQAEYGLIDEPIHERTKFRPIMSYGVAKLASCVLTRKECELFDMEHVCARIFSVYGCFDNENTMIDYAIKCFSGGEHASFGNRFKQWNFLNERDAGAMIYRLGAACVSPGEYLIANPVSQTIGEYVDIIASMFETPKYSFETEEDVELFLDVKNTIKETGYRPAVSFGEGIKEIIDFRKRDEKVY